MFAPFFFQGTGEAPPRPRDIIGKSLRFRGAQTLERTGINTNTGSTSGTFSVWYKMAYTVDGSTRTIFNTTQNGSGQLNPSFKTSSGYGFFAPSAANNNLTTDTYFADPSAWYHIVTSYDSSTTKLWINGRFINEVTTDQPGILHLGNQYIGSAGTVQFFEGYLADFYVIEGRQLPPTEFGKYDDNGVWVPIINDSLKAPGGMYSNHCAGYAGSYNASSTAQNYEEAGPVGLFNGTTAGDGCRTPGEGFINANFDPPLTGVDSLRIFAGYWNSIRINGTEVLTYAGNSAPYEWNDLTQFIPANGEIKQIAYGDSSGSGTSARASAIEVNGQILVDSTIYSNDLFTFQGTQSLLDNGPTASELASTAKNFNEFAPPYMGFDNNVGTYTYTDYEQAWLFRPSNPIQNVTKIEIQNGTGEKLWINGVVSAVTGNDTKQTFYSGPAITLETLAGFYNPLSSTAQSGFGAMWINGVELIDGTSAGYGPNGFHLQFADPDNIGLDTSGNGNNFTGTGFDLSPVDVWSSDLFTNNSDTAVPDFNSTQKDFYTGGPDTSAIYGFDGNNGTYAGTSNPGSWLFWRPTPQTVQSTIALQCTFELESIYINEVLVDWNDVQDGGGGKKTNPIVPFTGTLTNLAWRGKAATFASTVAILQIDGVTYVDNEGVEYDSVTDSPTQNFSTYNPLSGELPLVNANLKTDSATTTWQTTASTFRLDSGKWAWQVNRRGTNGYCGILAEYQSQAPDFSAGGTGFPAFSVQLDISTYTGKAVVYVNPSATAGSGYTAMDYGTTPVVQFSNIIVRVDADAGTIAFDIDGVTGADIDYTQYVDSSPVFPCLTGRQGGDTFVSFGQIPLLDSVPADYQFIQTQNLPEATIPDGREYFRAIEGTGVGTFKMYPEGVANTAGTGKTTQPMNFDGDFVYTPINYGLAVPSYVLDGFVLQDSITFTVDPSWGANAPIGVYTSVDGITWTQGTDIPGFTGGQTYTVPAPSPSRFWRFSWDRAPNGYINFGNISTTNQPLLTRAQEAFPKGFYWIKDIQNTNNWQFVSFMTGLGNANYSGEFFFTSGSPLNVDSTAKNFTNPQNAFDGSLSTFETTSTATDYVILRKEFTGVSSLRVYAQNGIGEIYVNGVNTNTTGSANSWVSVPLSSTTVTSVAIKATGTGNNNFLKAIEINGSILMDTGEAKAIGFPNYSAALTDYVAPTGNSIAYCWNTKNDPVLNTDGGIPTMVSVDQKAGMSLFTYNGTGAFNTVGHGLGKVPEFFIIKSTTATDQLWDCYYGDKDSRMVFNSSGASAASGDWRNTAPTTTTIELTGGPPVQQNGQSYICMCWTSIPGFSSIGTYEGNSNNDGPFIFTGFKVAFLMIKRYNGGTDWVIYDSTRDPTNPVDEFLVPNKSNASVSSDSSNGTIPVEFLSNGFKIRDTTSGTTNASSGDYVYLAFASNPFGGENTSPVTAY